MSEQYLSLCAFMCLSTSPIWRCMEGGDKIFDVLLRAKMKGGFLSAYTFVCVCVCVFVSRDGRVGNMRSSPLASGRGGGRG